LLRPGHWLTGDVAICIGFTGFKGSIVADGFALPVIDDRANVPRSG
jgi:hypothetical protein